MNTARWFLMGSFLLSSAAGACDLCAVYASLQAKESARGWFAGAYEQYTHFGTLREEGDKVPNPEGQKLDSSITQVFLGYQFAQDLGIQANLPYVHRSFRRPEEGGVRSGTESGLGDTTLLAHWRPVLAIRSESLFALTLLGGVKLPTGDSGRIAEELAEGDEEESGIHGHDLALGSGSLDGLVGVTGFLRYRRLSANGSVQYSIRSRGDFDYRYADDLGWSLGSSYYVSLEHENTLTAGLVLSGEHKGEDSLAGIKTEDTAIDAVYLGPQFTYSRGSSLYAELAADFPLRQQNSGLQALPDYRVRVALTWRP